MYDYISHVDSVSWLQSSIYIDPSSKQDHLWVDHPNKVSTYDPESADMLFIAGTDWRALEYFPGIEDRKPIINLIQHVRHANANLELYSYLQRKAIRICVSPEVSKAIVNTGLCNGPVYTINNCIDLSLMHPKCSRPHLIEVLIAGLKQPKIAQELTNRLKILGISVVCLDSQIERADYLKRIEDAFIVVTLPNESEGFYLPALEVMAMGKALVCPDCIGNRSFCRDGVNCLMPQLNVNSLEEDILSLLRDPIRADSIAANALAESQLHDIRKERSMFLELIGKVASTH